MKSDQEIIDEIERMDKLIKSQDYLIIPDFRQLTSYAGNQSRLDSLIPYLAADIKVSNAFKTIINRAMIFSPYSLAVKLLAVAVKALFAKGPKENKLKFEESAVINESYGIEVGKPILELHLGSSSDDFKSKVIDDILKVFAEQANPSTFSEQLKNIFHSKNISVAELERRSNIEYSYLHKLIYNKLRPNANISRDLTIKLCLAFELDLHEANDLMSKAGYILCGNTERDRLLSICVQNKVGVRLTNEILHQRKLPLLDKGEKKQKVAEN